MSSMMEKLPMCRICLAENVRMHIVVNRNLRELYEKLTDIPFVTEDSRPILACFFCCAKLKQCYRLLRKCQEAEELFAQMMNEDYEPNSLINQNRSEFCGGFITSPIVHISVVDECQTENIAIKEELPDVSEALDVIIELKQEHQIEELEPERPDNSSLYVAYTPSHHSESDLEDDVPLLEFKTEVKEDQEVSKKKQRAWETKRTAVAKKPKLDIGRIKPEDATTSEQTNTDKSDSKVIWKTQKPTRSFNLIEKKKQCTSSQIGETPYKCDVCQCSFSSNGNLTEHIRTHTGEKSYKCCVCQRTFSRKSILIQHNFVHTGEKPYKCDVCQRSFSRKSILIQHNFVHTGEKPYKCDVCQRCFNFRGHLTQHIRIHTGIKPYKCDVCKRSFRQTNALKAHIRIHTGEKPYKCDVCQRSFTIKGHLIDHARIHTGEKPYKCDVCQRSFSQNRHLIEHTRIHTGEKPYKCDVCQRRFSRRRNLIVHIRTHKP